MAALEKRWGTLPPTWSSTSRADGSDIRWFRVKGDTVGWPGQAGPGIETVRREHRYAVVPPSEHDERPHREYCCVKPNGAWRKRTADKRQIKFQAFSKDYDEPVRVLLDVAPRGSDEPKFTYAGDLDTLGEHSKEEAKERRRQLLDTMKEEQWYSRSDLVEATGFSESSIKRYVNTLMSERSLADINERGPRCRYWKSGQ